RDGDLDFALCDSERIAAFACDAWAHRPLLNFGFAAPKRAYQQPCDAPGPTANRRALEETLAFWLDRGVDGFRVDRPAALGKGAPDKVATRRLWRSIAHWLRERFDDRALIAEWGSPETAIDAGFDADVLAPERTAAESLMLGPETLPPRSQWPYFDANG